MSDKSAAYYSRRAALISGAAIAALACGAPAFAQQNNGTAVEEVVVTGTSIRGVAPVGSSLIGVTRDQINAVAPTNTKDLLATVPALGNFGTNAEQSTPNRFRTQGYLANIHNLGIYASLTLLNGHRVALTGTEGPFPDPSAVPPIAIQRTEIIADGASAIYGSDATAGVVNFIYRKPFDGLETQATYSFDGETRYEKRNFGAIGGRTWDGGGVMVAYEYSSNKSPLNTEIDFLALGGDQRTRGGRDLRGTNCLTPTIRRVTASGVPTGATYGSSSLNFTTVAADQRCGILSPSTIISDGERNSVLATIEHQATDTVKVWAELNYSHFEGESIGTRGTFSVLLPRSNPFFTAANIPPALFNDPTVTRVSIARAANGLFGSTALDGGTSTVTTFVTGMDIDLGHDWKGVTSLVLSRTRDTNGRPNGIDTINLINALNDTNPATALNPFGQAAQNNPTTLARIDNGAGQLNWGQQGLQELQFKADGPVTELPGGTLRAAAGVSFRASQSNQLQLGGSRSPTAGFDQLVRDDHPRQQVSAAFFELNVPVVSDKNALPLVQELTMSISGRYDYYDRYGGSFNPKYGVVYSPGADLRFHASYGTNFNAPNVGILGGLFGQPQYNSNLNATIGYGPFKGILLNNINQYRLGGTGGSRLTPEEAKTKSFGFDWTPSYAGLIGLRVGVNWYHVDYSNLFFKVTGTDLITNPAFASLVEFFPTPERMQELYKLYPPATPVTVATFEYVPHTEATNLGMRVYEGLDYDISYTLNTDTYGAFRTGVTANQQLKLDQQVLPGQAFEDRLNTTDAVKWKLRYSAGWAYGNFSINAFMNYVHSYNNISVTPFQKVKANKTVDLTAAYEFKDVGVGFLKGVTLQGRVANLFDKDPPFYDSANGYDGNQASPFPRSYDLTLRAKF
jgi:iron complex outermembrane receptor protein